MANSNPPKQYTESEVALVGEITKSLDAVKDEALSVLTVVLQQLSAHFADATSNNELKDLVKSLIHGNSINASLESVVSEKATQNTDDSITLAEETYNIAAFSTSNFSKGKNDTQGSSKDDKVEKIRPRNISEISTDVGIAAVRQKATSVPSGGAIVAALDESNTNRRKTEDLLRRYESLKGLSVVSQKYLLAVALASLCNAIYQLLSVEEGHISKGSSRNSEENGSKDTTGKETAQAATSGNEIHTDRLIKKLSLLEIESERMGSLLTPSELNIWFEVQSLFGFVQLAVTTLSFLQSDKESVQSSDSMGAVELAPVLRAIERVAKVAPRLMDQTVILTREQELKLETAVFWKLIVRLNQGMESYENQRAPLTDKRETLNNIINQLAIAGKRRLDDQRADVSEKKILEIDGARVGAALERGQKMRFEDQEYVSKEAQLLDDIIKTQQVFNCILNNTRARKFESQRYVPSETKQRDMYLLNLGARVDQAETHRLQNQDAVLVTADQKKERFFDQIASVLDRVPQRMDDQCAQFKPRKPNTEANEGETSPTSQVLTAEPTTTSTPTAAN